MILSIDPGLRAMGVALFTMEGTFYSAGLVRNPEMKHTHLGAHRSMAMAFQEWLDTPRHRGKWISGVAYEWPQIYPGRKTPPKDLLHLTGVLGAVAMAMPNAVSDWTPYAPREWKGQVPKAVDHARTVSVLSRLERDLLNDSLKGIPRSLSHNTLDAVGIGLHHLERR